MAHANPHPQAGQTVVWGIATDWLDDPKATVDLEIFRQVISELALVVARTTRP